MVSCGFGGLKWLGRGWLPLTREALEWLAGWISLQWRCATPSLTVSGLILDGNADQEKGIAPVKVASMNTASSLSHPTSSCFMTIIGSLHCV